MKWLEYTVQQHAKCCTQQYALGNFSITKQSLLLVEFGSQVGWLERLMMGELATEATSGKEEYATYIDDFDSSSCELTTNQGM